MTWPLQVFPYSAAGRHPAARMPRRFWCHNQGARAPAFFPWRAARTRRHVGTWVAQIVGSTRSRRLALWNILRTALPDSNRPFCGVTFGQRRSPEGRVIRS